MKAVKALRQSVELSDLRDKGSDSVHVYEKVYVDVYLGHVERLVDLEKQLETLWRTSRVIETKRASLQNAVRQCWKDLSTCHATFAESRLNPNVDPVSLGEGLYKAWRSVMEQVHSISRMVADVGESIRLRKEFHDLKPLLACGRVKESSTPPSPGEHDRFHLISEEERYHLPQNSLDGLHLGSNSAKDPKVGLVQLARGC